MQDESSWIQTQHAPLNVGDAYAFLQTPAAGGIALFVGTTRRWTDGKETQQLEYQAYLPMATKEMQRLAAAAKARWPTLRTCLLHRLGVVPAAEASVIVGVAAAHRAPAYEACRYLIDTLKRQVPIWKCEHYVGGTTEWIGGGDQPAPELQVPD